MISPLSILLAIIFAAMVSVLIWIQLIFLRYVAYFYDISRFPEEELKSLLNQIIPEDQGVTKLESDGSSKHKKQDHKKYNGMYQ